MPWPFLSRWWARRSRPRRGESLGAWGERYAARQLRRAGYRILARRQRDPLGEIDLVTLHDRKIVFVEVKTRRGRDEESPAEAVDHDKQRRLTQLALRYLKRHRLLEQPCRFDVVAITLHDNAPPEFRHLEGAFEATSSDPMFG